MSPKGFRSLAKGSRHQQVTGGVKPGHYESGFDEAYLWLWSDCRSYARGVEGTQY